MDYVLIQLAVFFAVQSKVILNFIRSHLSIFALISWVLETFQKVPATAYIFKGLIFPSKSLRSHRKVFDPFGVGSYLSFILSWLFLCVGIYVRARTSPSGGITGSQEPSSWVMGTKLSSSVRAEHDLNHWAQQLISYKERDGDLAAFICCAYPVFPTQFF